MRFYMIARKTEAKTIEKLKSVRSGMSLMNVVFMIWVWSVRDLLGNGAEQGND